jgi:large subunit ribosomal protein L15e
MGYLKYVAAAWKNPKKGLGDAYRAYLLQWRKEPVTLRIEHPTRPDRAHALGWKAKTGFIVVRQRVLRGGKQRPDIKGGRSTGKQTQRLTRRTSYQEVCEQRASRAFVNCEVLNSYWVGEDGKHVWYEIILIDRDHPNILANVGLRNVARQKGRVWRGLTSAGKASRGLRNKGQGAEKMRPSRRARSH